MHDPRGKKGMGLSYAVSHKGGDHMETFHDELLQIENVCPELGLTKGLSRFDTKGKAPLIKKGEDYWGVLGDTLTFCKLSTVLVRAIKPNMVLEFFNTITGKDLTLEELLNVGERIFNLCRVYNVREGISRRDDILPDRFAESHSEGASAGHSLKNNELEKMLDEYYSLRGWDENGIPTRKTLKRINLKDISEKIEY
jgi:aldehyde:ferredoxin oxidoreductase